MQVELIDCWFEYIHLEDRYKDFPQDKFLFVNPHGQNWAMTTTDIQELIDNLVDFLEEYREQA